jgi:hypothetical protein
LETKYLFFCTKIENNRERKFVMSQFSYRLEKVCKTLLTQLYNKQMENYDYLFVGLLRRVTLL